MRKTEDSNTPTDSEDVSYPDSEFELIRRAARSRMVAFQSQITEPVYYAGIGARRTPQNVLRFIRRLGKFLADRGFTLRSGGSAGADSAFESGCDEACGTKEIFLPWKGFHRNPSPLYLPSEKAIALAEIIHPAWNRCTTAARLLHARNCHQILGRDLKTPVNFLIFWAHEKEGLIEGRTATAVNLARCKGIPVFNLENDQEFKDWNAISDDEQCRKEQFWRSILSWANSR